jgi:hypothetical protein
LYFLLIFFVCPDFNTICVLPNTTRENKTNIVTVKAINSNGYQIAKSDVAKDIHFLH